MQLAFRDISALATARRAGTSLANEIKSTDDKAPPPAEGPNISTALEALRAVLPATLITLYSTAVILLQNLTNAAGAASRASQQAALATQHGADTPALKAALEALPAEPDAFALIRVGFAAVWIILVAFYAYRSAQPTRRVRGAGRVLLEPAVATGAFVAWALASPGTFLAAYMNPTNLAVATIVIAFIGAAVLLVISDTVLKKKAEPPAPAR